ncbi:MAG: hypothetical protein BIFFINMI_03241 [Phycisphaerae bacterium]|nr:hypothetical protein [Phycisphaerae bacterium]
MRLFERAAIRARLPLRWGKGFNPRPRLSLPLPRPLGVASDDEMLVLELMGDDDATGHHAPLSPAQVRESLSPQMPADVRLVEALGVARPPRPASVRYRVELPADQTPADLDARIAALLASDRCIVQRVQDETGSTQPRDIRPHLAGVAIEPGGAALAIDLTLDDRGTARPTEVLEALGLDAAAMGHRITRLRVEWGLSPCDPTDGRGSDNGTTAGKEQ